MSIELQDLARLLSYINPDDRDVWKNVGNGLKTEFGEPAFTHWDAWSAGADNYKAKTAKDVWKSLRPGMNTLGTVIFLAKEKGWTPENKDLTPAQKRQIKADQEARRIARQAEVEADDAKLLSMQKAVAKGCQKVWENYCHDFGESEYLKRKQVGRFGIKFFHQSVLLWINDDNGTTGVVSGATVFEFFAKQPKPRPDNIHFLMFKRGTIVVPLRDAEGMLWALQAINGTGVKLFPKFGRKAGLYHVIGKLAGATVIALAEGYATAASIHMATEWPVVVAFDAGNLVPVAATVRQQCPDAKLLICADLDVNGKGQSKAHEAATASGAAVVLPDFGDLPAGANDDSNKPARSL